MCLSLCSSMTQAVGAETKLLQRDSPGSQLLLMCVEVIGKLRLMKGKKEPWSGKSWRFGKQ